MKKVLIISGVILLIVIIGFLGFYLFENIPTISQPPELAECEKLEENKKDSCYIKLAVKTNNTLMCNEIDSSTNKDECYFEIAINSKNPLLCNKILENNKMNQCNAIVQGDVELCDEIMDNGTKNMCYMSLAYSLEDSSLCDKILEKNLSIACEALVLKNHDLCENLEDAPLIPEEVNESEKASKIVYRDNCLFNVAQASKDISICDKIKDQIIKEGCKQTLSKP